MTRTERQALSLGALLLGLGLLAITLANVDLRSVTRLAGQLGAGLPIVLLPSAAWHLVRTAAWLRCFPAVERPAFARAFRVRLAAEAFSFVTVRGVAGEPLKVVLLAPAITPVVAAAAVALERAAYLLVTAVLVTVSALVAATLLALSGVWIRVFGGMAVGSIFMILALLFVVSRPERRLSDLATSTRTPDHSSFVKRFGHEFVEQLRSLMHVDRRRLALLVGLETLAYVLMALEVWVVLWAAGAPISALGAVAVETFTRVTSLASAFIPANLGALEASNVAAATALGAASGAAALALVRRIRGLLWCVAGFAIYPRPHSRNSAERSPDAPRLRHRREFGDTASKALIILDEPVSDLNVLDEVGGMPLGERLARAAARAGYGQLLIWSPRHTRDWDQIARRLPGGMSMAAIDDRAKWQETISKLNQAAPPAVVTSDLVPLTIDDTGSLQGTRVVSRRDLPRAERELRRSIFKRTDGRLGRFNRRMSIPVSVALIRWTRLSPHAMSVLIVGLGLYSGWMFSRGDYLSGVLAALLSLAASILDGCDGELARLQYKESAFGCWMDTAGDYIYYLAVFAGLTVGMVRHTGWSGFWWIGAAVLAGSLLTFLLLIVLRSRITEGQPGQLRTITKAHFYGTRQRWAHLVARLSTCATRATMPYGILALAILNLLPVVLILAALGAQIYWISLALQLRQLLNAARPAFPVAVS